MTYLLLSLLACPPSSDGSSGAVSAPAKPFCTWEEGICFDDPLPLLGEPVIVHSCVDYPDDPGETATVCAPTGWRIFDDGTWEPATCTGDYWRACISY